MNTWLIRFAALVYEKSRRIVKPTGRDNHATMTPNSLLRTTIFLLLGFAAPHLNAQSSEPEMLAILDYKTVPLVVETIPSNTANLSEEAVQTRAELRMRSAELKPISGTGPTPFRYVYVNVHVVDNAFTLDVSFYREAVWVVSPGKSGDGMVATPGLPGRTSKRN